MLDAIKILYSLRQIAKPTDNVVIKLKGYSTYGIANIKDDSDGPVIEIQPLDKGTYNVDKFIYEFVEAADDSRYSHSNTEFEGVTSNMFDEFMTVDGYYVDDIDIEDAWYHSTDITFNNNSVEITFISEYEDEDESDNSESEQDYDTVIIPDNYVYADEIKKIA